MLLSLWQGLGILAGVIAGLTVIFTVGPIAAIAGIAGILVKAGIVLTCAALGGALGSFIQNINAGDVNPNLVEQKSAYEAMAEQMPDEDSGSVSPPPSMTTEEQQEMAKQAAGWSDTGSSQGGTATPDNTSSQTVLQPAAQPMSAAAVQEVAKQTNGNASDTALAAYLDNLAKLSVSETDIQKKQSENVIENPFDKKSDTVKEDDTKAEETSKEFELAKETMDFDARDFDGLDGYTWIINNVPVKMYVKSEINLMSEDEEFTVFSATKLESEKYVDAKGQTHAISKAYDADGNQLDKTIWSEQIGYLEYGSNGSYGYVKFIGEGNKSAYSIEGYGENTFTTNALGSKVYFKGSAELTDKEKDREVLLGTNSDIVSKKEYKFKDEMEVEYSSTDANAIADGYKAAIQWGANIMRDVNLQSFTLDFGEAELVIETEEDKKEDIKTLEENGVTYTYNANTTITNKTTGATYNIQDVLDNKMKTMKELVDEGFEPETINGKKLTGKDDVKKAITAAKPAFTIKIDDAPAQENYEREVFYTDEDGMKYYFNTKRSYRYHIVTEQRTYGLLEALEVYTIEELMDAGLDCGKSKI